MLKRPLAWLLTVCMVLAMFPLNVFADESTITVVLDSTDAAVGDDVGDADEAAVNVTLDDETGEASDETDAPETTAQPEEATPEEETEQETDAVEIFFEDEGALTSMSE